MACAHKSAATAIFPINLHKLIPNISFDTDEQFALNAENFYPAHFILIYLLKFMYFV